MSKKFIPNGDYDFAMMAESFARNIANDPRAFGISDDDMAALDSAVKQFRATLTTARQNATKSPIATVLKEEARGVAEKIVRRIGNIIRANDAISTTNKMLVGMREAKSKPKQLSVPNESPKLKFVQAKHHTGAVPEHELTFTSRDYTSKPDGAVRLELFVSLISPDVKVPQYANSEGAPMPVYLRSYTKSPIRLQPPMANKPMRVIYWARWADAQGNVGPFSETAAGWIEGGSHHLMSLEPRGFKRAELMDMSDIDDEAREQHTTVVVALVQAQRSLMQSSPRIDALPEPVQREIRQLEAPAEAA